MPPLFDQTAPSQQWYQAIAGIVTTAITVVETLQRAGLVFDANNLQDKIDAATAGHAVEGSTMTKEQATVLKQLIDTFGVYLNTPMAEGGLKPIQVLYRQWPQPLSD